MAKKQAKARVKKPTKTTEAAINITPRRIKPAKPKFTSAFQLFASAILIIRQHWRLFFGITLVYGLLSIVLVRGIGGGIDLSSLKTSLKGGLGGNYGELATGAALFSYLLGSSGSSSTAAGSTYQTMLTIIMSLVVIWALRQVFANKAIRVRDAFYKGMYPLVPFILVLLVIGLQLIPLAIGSWLYSTVTGTGIAASGLEKTLWVFVFFLLALASLYMLCSSLFALYIVTLPDMTPLKALRSARQLVRHRRFLLLRKILFLPLALLVVGAIIMIPLILFITPLAQWVFFAMSMVVLVLVHSYMYTLYRELI
ncbi:MAG TPA: hypothetical protein VLF90_04685 [Patescibacteria group bacterium]|nr:hypothetical protein [Patescibacteria group bacterium]